MTEPPTLDQLPAVFTRADTDRIGVSPYRLYSWRDDGLIEMLGRGLFMRAGTDGDTDLIEIAARAPGATLCLASALSHHGLTDEIPASVHIAIERSRRPPSTTAPVTWHRFDEATIEVDRREIEVVDGYSLGVFGPTRSVIDAFRLRHLEGHETAIEALRRWLKVRGNQPSKLIAMLRYFPATKKAIQAALGVLL